MRTLAKSSAFCVFYGFCVKVGGKRLKVLDGNANMPKASAKLHPEHFYVKVHTDIYTVMMQMFAASDNIDVVTVLENCMKNNVIAGGRQKLSCKADGNRPQHLKR